MKFIALLLVIFSGLLYLFGSEEKERVETMASVAGSLGFVRAAMDGMTRTSGKRRDSSLNRHPQRPARVSSCVTSTNAGPKSRTSRSVKVG